MRALVFSSTTVILVAVLCTPAVFADVGGGSGAVASPWRTEGPKDAADIERVKEEAVKFRTLSVPGSVIEPGRTRATHLRQVALGLEGADGAEARSYALRGRLPSGASAVVPFSELDSFIVKSRTGKKMVLAVTVWPDISPATLFAEQPTYQQLMAGYRRKFDLEVDLKKDGRRLVFVDDLDFMPAVPLDTLPVKTEVLFRCEEPGMAHPRELWWAIPSVIGDPSYPYRAGATKD